MPKSYRILILGIGQSNFLDQLYGKVKELDKDNSFKFSINTYKEFFQVERDKHDKPYDKFFEFKPRTLERGEFRKTIIKLAFQRIFWITIYFGIKERSSWKKIKNRIGHIVKVKHLVEQTIIPFQFDIVHIHFCIPEYLLPIYFFKKKMKTVCSFWGSDLLRVNDPKDIFYQKFFLNRVDQITVQTSEMAEILFSKVSRKLKDKTKCLKFTLAQDIFDNIDRFREEKELLNVFKKNIGLPSNKIIVSIGHNGFPENNHIEIINELTQLKNYQLQNFCFFIHASYGASTEYIDKLKQIDFLDIRIITEFFESVKIAKLRLITDLLIQMPTTDALSAAMTEVLYAGNSVLSGSWLPYEEFKRKGIFHSEIKSFDLIPGFLSKFDNNRISKDLQTINRINLKRYFFPDATTPEWIELYKNLGG